MSRSHLLLATLAAALSISGRGARSQNPTQFVDRIANPSTTTRGVRAVDWNGDGALDIVTLVPDAVILLTNDGTGDFTSRSVLPLGVTMATAHLVVGDLDGDADADAMVVGNPQWTLLRNDGAGGASIEVQRTNTAALLADSALIDLDTDGDLDLVYFDGSGIATSLNDGSGLFLGSLMLPTTSPFLVQVLFADLNGDGREDILALTPLGGNSLLLSAPSGYFDASANVGSMSSTLDTVVGDLDGDGHVDVGQIGGSIWRGRSDGTFQPQGSLPATAFSVGVVADIDLDGDADILGVTGSFGTSSILAVLIQDGAGRWSVASQDRVANQASGTQMLATGDFDGDGDLDAYAGASVLTLAPADDFIVLNHHTQLETPDPVATGGTLRLVCSRQPGYGIGLGLGLIALGAEARQPVQLPFGTLHLGPGAVSLPFVALPAPTGVAELRDPVPADPALVGLEFAVQALIIDVLGGEAPRLTNRRRVRVQ